MGSMGGGSFGWSEINFNISTIDHGKIWQIFLWQTLLGNKYKPNEKDYEFVGIKSARLIWLTDSGIDNSTDDAGNSGLTVNTFDTTTEADSAQIKLENTGGSTETIRGAAIRGKPVIRLSGENGWLHNELVDYEDIYKNGEKKFELGNNYIVTKDQVEQLADFHWKNFRDKRHVYAMTMKGTRYWFSPGQWYTLTFNYGGEYIDSVCECYSCQTERGVHDVGTTVVSFREVYENWSKDSNAIARFIAGGNPKNAPDYGRMVVASSTHLGGADYYCDGTSDEDEINAAISELAGIGGGVIELTEGIYYIDGAIVPANNIMIAGKGWDTIIEKNGNFNGINLTGSDGSEYYNISLRDFKITRNSSDTNSTYLLNLDYVDNSFIENIYIYNSYSHGCVLANCDNILVKGCLATDCDYGFDISGSAGVPIRIKILSNESTNNNYGYNIISIEHTTITGNVAYNNNNSGFLFTSSNNNSIVGNISTDNGEYGISLGASDSNIVNGNITEGNQTGIYINPATSDRNVITGNRSTNNSVSNFTDNGTNTTDSGNDWN